MSGDSGPPRSETNTNGDVLAAFSFRSADTSSRSSVCTLSIGSLESADVEGLGS